MTKWIATLGVGAALAFAAPNTAEAQPVVNIGGGLVNVQVGNVTILEDVAVGAALGVAAALCDINVNVLATQFRTGDATCTSTSDGQTVTIQR